MMTTAKLSKNVGLGPLLS